MPRNLEKNVVSRGEVFSASRQTENHGLDFERSILMNEDDFLKKKFYLVVRKETVGKRNERESQCGRS